MNGIEVKNITKTFGSVRALHDVSVTIEPNKIYGLLGRNGAGKTTLLNIITTRIFADSGSVTIDDKDAATNAEAMQNVYMMSEKNYYPESMKVKEMFRWSKEFYPSFDVDYANSLAQKFELDTNKKFKFNVDAYGDLKSREIVSNSIESKLSNVSLSRNIRGLIGQLNIQENN